MAPSFDCAVSSLLCAEDNNSIFYDNDCLGGLGAEFEMTWDQRNHRNLNQNRGFCNGNALPLQSEECLALIVEKEHQHMPNADYLKRLQSGDLEVGVRTEAVDWIGKVGSSKRLVLSSSFFCIYEFSNQGVFCFNASDHSYHCFHCFILFELLLCFLVAKIPSFASFRMGFGV